MMENRKALAMVLVAMVCASMITVLANNTATAEDSASVFAEMGNGYPSSTISVDQQQTSWGLFYATNGGNYAFQTFRYR